MVLWAFVFVAYICIFLGLVAIGAWAIDAERYGIWLADVFVCGPILIGTTWYVINRGLDSAR
jgi:hypothetical protein